ncbi:ABC transporter, iron(III) dicitrate-binding periplasmic protein [Nostoc sp. NIES-2111]|nr:ABC transporter, iron(III) dicitrate-binding periplasmic protein [Nostoc sp. NIES-2111]
MKISLRHLLNLLLLGVLTFTLTSACSSNINYSVTSLKQPQQECQVVQHAMGKTCIPRHPQRVVTLWMGTFCSTLALGIKPIASTWNPGEPLPDYLRNKVNDVEIVGTLSEPNLEKILLLKPDLILGNTRSKNIYQQLSEIAPTVVMNLPSPPVSWQQHLEDTAKFLNKEQESKQLIANYGQRIAQIRQALEDSLDMQVSVATVDQMFGIYIYGKNHPAGAVLKDIGLQRPDTQRGDFFIKDGISPENLSTLDGDVLFLSYRGDGAKKTLEKLQQNPLWKKLKVVQQNRVYLVDSDHWYAFDVLAMNAVIDDLFKYLVKTPDIDSK